VHAPTEDEDDIKDNFYEELEQVFDQFLGHCMKILLGDSNANGGRKDIFKHELIIRVYMKLVMIMKSALLILQL
jgi:hypothetical protein